MKYIVRGTLRHAYDPDKPVFLYNNDAHSQKQRITKSFVSSETILTVQSDSPTVAEDLALVFRHLGMADAEVAEL